ncbi:hypothetical protein ACFOSV_12800 [Algoriphagus namhaensis]|uniref:Uncharacterized protein n=1 Tax=Algoriphagus namhaensis TaxID=915353 RepID=A0ABV8ATY5_9BACT
MINEESKVYFKRFIPFIVILIGIPLLSFAFWYFYPTTKFQILVVDKTVASEMRREHSSFFWILDHLRFVKEDGNKYNSDKDYFGFFPDGSATFGESKGLGVLSEAEVVELARSKDFIFFADTYGVFQDDFIEGESEDISSKIYGGLSAKDILLIREARANNKTIVAEYNTMASPTSRKNRVEFENLMGIKWTGWIGRYYETSDTIPNPDIPDWFIREYKAQNQGNWLPEGSGIIFVHEDGRLFALQSETDYLNNIPEIRTQPINKHGFDLPEIMPYPDWFDIVLVERSYEVISYYDINPTSQGMQKLRDMGLPRFFPAAVVQDTSEGQLYYLSGDFSDLRQDLGSSHFTGLPGLWRGLHLISNYNDREAFFWNYYYPLMSQILKKSALRKAEKKLPKR